MCFDKSLFLCFWLINSSQKIYILNCCGICYYNIFVKHREKRELNTRQKSEKKLQIKEAAMYLPQIDFSLFCEKWFHEFFYRTVALASSFVFFGWMHQRATGREWEFQIFAFYCFCSSNKTKKKSISKTMSFICFKRAKDLVRHTQM